ncbi:MAG: DegV family protein [Oscillospiraceae bacterium]|nr:DegV family protein [Oscillospiraceae bacterium]
MMRDGCMVKVPLRIDVGSYTILDDENFDQKLLLEKMAAWHDAPQTACPSPAQYLAEFEDGKDNYVVTLTAKLSGSYNAAIQAASIYKEDGGKANIHVFNSRSASSGQVQIALLIRDLCEKGLCFEKVVEQVEAYISRMQTRFVLENLENLRKNGRLTKMQALVTGALHVKLYMGATREGEIEKLGQGLSTRQTLVRMVASVAEDGDHVGRRLVISHCNCPDRAEYLRQQFEQKCRFSEIFIVPTGGISTVYAYDGGTIIAY